MLGFLLLTVAIIIISSSEKFNIPVTAGSIIAGMFLSGFAIPMISIPLFTECLEAIEVAYPDKYTFRHELWKLNNITAGLFTGFSGLAMCLSPPTAGLLANKLGYSESFEILGLVLLAYLFLYFILCGNISMFVYPKIN